MEFPFDFILDGEVIEEIGEAVGITVIFWRGPKPVTTPNLPCLLSGFSALFGHYFENITSVKGAKRNNPGTDFAENHYFDLIVGEPEIVGPASELEMLSDHEPDV
jgi:hypothetical protein